MIEATQGAGAVSSAGAVASAPVAGGEDKGEFGKALQAHLPEGSAKGVEAGAVRAKGKGQAVGDKRTQEHKAGKLQAGVEATGDVVEAQAPASASAGGVAAVIAAAAEGPKPAGQVVDAAGGEVAAKASPATGIVAAPAAALLPVLAATTTPTDAGAAVPVTALVAGLRAGPAVASETAKIAGLPAGEATPVVIAPSAAVAGSVASAHGSAKEAAPVAGAKFDAEPAVRADEARVFEASSGALEVGVANSTHGWLRVRAEVDDGGAVVAQVMAANAGAAEGLHKELPALSAFLVHEQVGVSSVVVHAPASSAGAQDAALAFAQDQGGEGRSGGGKGMSSAGPGAADGQEVADSPGTVLNLPSQLGGGVLHGGWLSVRV